jgi:hypothetical protein
LRTLDALAQASLERLVLAYGFNMCGDGRPNDSDFELGMLNGKLSALHWVLGTEWDFLDTRS